MAQNNFFKKYKLPCVSISIHMYSLVFYEDFFVNTQKKSKEFSG